MKPPTIHGDAAGSPGQGVVADPLSQLQRYRTGPTIHQPRTGRIHRRTQNLRRTESACNCRDLAYDVRDGKAVK
jgi:2-oxoglutarate dehydrogenase complex dehydrogenase (E1) component-like enzyme